MPNVGIKIDGVMVLVLGASAAALYVYFAKRELITETINPASDKNFVYQGLGPENVAPWADKKFIALTLANPFASAESKARARELYNTFYGN